MALEIPSPDRGRRRRFLAARPARVRGSGPATGGPTSRPAAGPACPGGLRRRTTGRQGHRPRTHLLLRRLRGARVRSRRGRDRTGVPWRWGAARPAGPADDAGPPSRRRHLGAVPDHRHPVPAPRLGAGRGAALDCRAHRGAGRRAPPGRDGGAAGRGGRRPGDARVLPRLGGRRHRDARAAPGSCSTVPRPTCSPGTTATPSPRGRTASRATPAGIATAATTTPACSRSPIWSPPPRGR